MVEGNRVVVVLQLQRATHAGVGLVEAEDDVVLEVEGRDGVADALELVLDALGSQEVGGEILALELANVGELAVLVRLPGDVLVLEVLND